MTDTVNVPTPYMVEQCRKLLQPLAGNDWPKVARQAFSLMTASAPKAEPVGDHYELDSVVKILTGQHKGKTGTIEMEHPVRGAVRIFLVQIEDGPTANYRADEIDPADTEAPKVEQGSSFLGHVITYPDGRKPDFAPASEDVSVGESCTVTAAFSHPWDPAPASDELLEALAPFARLEVPKRTVGNAGTYLILHSDIRRAADLYAKHKGPQS